MNVLLDSHVVLWWLAGGALLSPRVQRTLSQAGRILISPISCWEVALLASRGRVRLDRDTHAWVEDLFGMEKVREAPLSPAAAVSGALMDPAAFPGDPADRLIYATARELGVPLVSKDRGIRGYARKAKDVRVIW